MNTFFISRREALQRLAILVGGTLSLPVQAALRGQTLHTDPIRFTPAQQTLIADLAEVIMPTTNTPGAKTAEVGDFIEHVIRYCSAAKQQEAFQQGLTQTDALSQTTFGKIFAQLDSPQRVEVVTQLTQREKPFFLMMKELTVVGYFTSEIGATQALDYVVIPGRFQGDIPLKAGQRTWAL
jgi:hypothetical protein